MSKFYAFFWLFFIVIGCDNKEKDRENTSPGTEETAPTQQELDAIIQATTLSLNALPFPAADAKKDSLYVVTLIIHAVLHSNSEVSLDRAIEEASGTDKTKMQKLKDTFFKDQVIENCSAEDKIACVNDFIKVLTTLKQRTQTKLTSKEKALLDDAISSLKDSHDKKKNNKSSTTKIAHTKLKNFWKGFVEKYHNLTPNDRDIDYYFAWHLVRTYAELATSELLDDTESEALFAEADSQNLRTHLLPTACNSKDPSADIPDYCSNIQVFKVLEWIETHATLSKGEKDFLTQTLDLIGVRQSSPDS